MDELHAMEAGFRSLGEGTDSRPELPQVIVGMAVIGDGIPVRCWCWPGETGDSGADPRARDGMRGWALVRIIWAGGRGFSSKEDPRHLVRAGGACILGGKLRPAAPGIEAGAGPPGPLPAGRPAARTL
jgi:hypothetical protein